MRQRQESNRVWCGGTRGSEGDRWLGDTIELNERIGVVQEGVLWQTETAHHRVRVLVWYHCGRS